VRAIKHVVVGDFLSRVGCHPAHGGHQARLHATLDLIVGLSVANRFQKVDGDAPLTVEIEAAATSLLVTHEWWPNLGDVFKKLATQKESRIEEGHLLADPVHMLIVIPPKYAVAQVIGFLKGKSAIHLARVHSERKRNFVGEHFWARGCFVSTVGRDEAVIRDYIRKQEQEDIRLDQLGLWR